MELCRASRSSLRSVPSVPSFSGTATYFRCLQGFAWKCSRPMTFITMADLMESTSKPAVDRVKHFLDGIAFENASINTLGIKAS
ncbi:hypothetical protein AVEN_119637-1 [Araneus ventricosus]|uniref:Uncharacterized protein n=1 Tax=Araneus ventricosus TaxID=182803 RepID=A0A4Y2MWK4_ARAVE|nr:hypothetical protein AVEN_112207-1 [Araneus ventricosus]GBN30736.1 hypothetical protein AVEN_119637-1 [Araneus ventricosus]